MAVTGQWVEMAVADRITTRVMQLNFTGNYTAVANGGEILDIKTATYVASYFDGMKQFSGRKPLTAWPLAMSGGFYFELIPVANQPTQYKVRIYQPGGTEVANATAYTALTGAMSGGFNLSAPESPTLAGFDIITAT